MKADNRSLYHADTLTVLERLDDGLFTLVYLDPPRATKKKGEQDLASHKQFVSRLVQQCRRLLNEQGALYFHAPAVSAVNYRLILDQIFQRTCSLAIVWKYGSLPYRSVQGAPDHDEILRYARTPRSTYNPITLPLDKSRFPGEDLHGPYRLVDMTTGFDRPALRQAWCGMHPPPGRSWAFSKDKLEQLAEEGRIVFSEQGVPRLKKYLNETIGREISSVWDDIPIVPSRSRRLPAEKPRELALRIIRQATNQGDWVLDPICGVGSLLTAAESLGRSWIGCEAAAGAVQIAQRDLEEISKGEVTLLDRNYVDAQVAVWSSYTEIFPDFEALQDVRDKITKLVEFISRIKSSLHAEGQSDDDVLEAIEENIPRLRLLVSTDARSVAIEVVQNRCDAFNLLTLESKEFLATAIAVVETLPSGLDYSAASISAWKAIEQELSAKIFDPFRQWMIRQSSETLKSLENDLNDEKTVALARYVLKDRKLTLGQMKWYLHLLATSRDLLSRSPALQSLKHFALDYFQDPEFLLTRAGFDRLISQENIDKYRNGAAHTTVFSKDQAQEAIDFVMQSLSTLLVRLINRNPSKI